MLMELGLFKLVGLMLTYMAMVLTYMALVMVDSRRDGNFGTREAHA